MSAWEAIRTVITIRCLDGFSDGYSILVLSLVWVDWENTKMELHTLQPLLIKVLTNDFTEVVQHTTSSNDKTNSLNIKVPLRRNLELFFALFLHRITFCHVRCPFVQKEKMKNTSLKFCRWKSKIFCLPLLEIGSS